MEVKIKKFNVEMEVKNAGIEFEIRSPGGEHLGDCYVTKTKLIWCRGRTQKNNGVSVTWEEFIEWMQSEE